MTAVRRKSEALKVAGGTTTTTKSVKLQQHNNIMFIHDKASTIQEKISLLMTDTDSKKETRPDDYYRVKQN